MIISEDAELDGIAVIFQRIRSVERTLMVNRVAQEDASRPDRTVKVNNTAAPGRKVFNHPEQHRAVLTCYHQELFEGLFIGEKVIAAKKVEPRAAGFFDALVHGVVHTAIWAYEVGDG